jgi:hypothetical protein
MSPFVCPPFRWKPHIGTRDIVIEGDGKAVVEQSADFVELQVREVGHRLAGERQSP